MGEIAIEIGGPTSSTNPFPSASKAADSIAITNDLSLTPPGMRVLGAIDGGTAVLVVDTVGFSHIVIETKQAGGSGSGPVPQINLGWWPL